MHVLATLLTVAMDEGHDVEVLGIPHRVGIIHRCVPRIGAGCRQFNAAGENLTDDVHVRIFAYVLLFLLLRPEHLAVAEHVALHQVDRQARLLTLGQHTFCHFAIHLDGNACGLCIALGFHAGKRRHIFGGIQHQIEVGWVYENVEHRVGRGAHLHEDIARVHRTVDGHRRNAHTRRVVVAELEGEHGGIVVTRHELVVEMLADEGDVVAYRLQQRGDVLIVVASGTVVVLRLVVLHQRTARVLLCHLLRHGQHVNGLGDGLLQFLVVHLGDAQLQVAALEACQRNQESAAGLAGSNGARQVHLLAIGLFALTRCHLYRANGLRTGILQSHQAVGRLTGRHQAVGREHCQHGNQAKCALGILYDEQDGQDAIFITVQPTRVALFVVVAIHPEVAAVLRVVRIDRGNGVDTTLHVRGEAHHELLHIIGNHVVRHRHRVPTRVAVTIAVFHSSLTRREVFAVEVVSDESFILASHLGSTPAHAHSLDGAAGIGSNHVLRDQDGAPHL